MASTTEPTTTTVVSYSYVMNRKDSTCIELLQTKDESTKNGTEKEAVIQFRILKGSLTANNKFYNDFGDKKPFEFFKCYPIDSKISSLVVASSPADKDAKDDDRSATNLEKDYVHPVVWGIIEVTKSRLDGVEVGSKYLAQLPIGESVSFSSAKVDPATNNSVIVDRPGVFPAYNIFKKWDGDNEDYEDLALACFPGIVTGFGLNFNLRNHDYYGADAVVLTSASSKVALALAVYLKHNNSEDYPGTTKKIIGYTSESNKEFCEKTGLYDEVLGYEDTLKNLESTTGEIGDNNNKGKKNKMKYIVVDVSGRGEVYKRNVKEPNLEIVKVFAVGNTSNTSDDKSTFSILSMFGMAKMILTMMGAPSFFTSWMNPVVEPYLIMTDMAELKSKWGNEKLDTMQKDYTRIFCKAAASNGWISIRTCDTEESIQKAFSDIVQGLIPPSETIILDTIKAVAHRK